jgi:hypothetical protein
LPDGEVSVTLQRMTQRARLVLSALLSLAVLGGSAAAAPKPAAPKPAAPKATQEVISIQRTAKTGLAALALIGKVQASKVPGFFASVDRDRNGAVLGTFVDFNAASGLTHYGHGTAEPLCDAPIVCSVDLSTDTLTFTITETDDADSAYSGWKGVTRYLTIRGTKIDVQVAAIGFTVKRHTSASFARVTRDQADTDGVDAYGNGAEVFRAAQLAGGAHGSFAALQLPCEDEGAGAATFSTAGDLVPPVVNCEPTQGAGTHSVIVVGGGQAYPDRPGLFSRSSEKAAAWQVSGAVTGLSSSLTRLFVLTY